jgi:hypothetical protein
MLGGAAPIPASSGQTVRVRLHRSGDRQLNQALHLVVLTRLRYDPATRAYAQRRRAQGKTNREIRRCLVRYVARQLYRLLEANPSLDPTEERPREGPAEQAMRAGPPAKCQQIRARQIPRLVRSVDRVGSRTDLLC